ncbi:helix-turn-helix domain-containing protein [Streptosporangium sp. NPDC002524]|uniref:helix-turn-helix domain-containing protein n=1 Tax=Streptosporangium sp. NPDC002524 TaxID=3154537 RepID=UPI0033188B63
MANRHRALLGQAVRNRRRELGIPTQRAAAELADLSHNTWQRLESGKQISLTSLNAVAEVLGWPMSYPTSILELGLIAPSAAEDDASIDHVQAPEDANVVMVPILVPPDVFRSLDEEDVQWLVTTVMQHGRELASTISDARRRGRIKQQHACGDT